MLKLAETCLDYHVWQSCHLSQTPTTVHLPVGRKLVSKHSSCQDMSREFKRCVKCVKITMVDDGYNGFDRFDRMFEQLGRTRPRQGLVQV